MSLPPVSPPPDPAQFQPPPTPAEIFTGLRRQALDLDPHQAGLDSTRATHPWLWGVVMETGYPNGIATLVCLADATTSLYLSGGGGTIGAGHHPGVAAATHACISTAEACIGAFPLDSTDHVPKVGYVRLHLLGWHDRRGAEVEEEAISRPGHAFAPVFHAAHAVVTQLRLVSS